MDVSNFLTAMKFGMEFDRTATERPSKFQSDVNRLYLNS